MYLNRIYVPCRDSELEETLNRMLSSLKQPSDRFEHRVTILRTNSVNALALPGGRLYVFSGLLNQSASPEEVMGVLAHEVAHAEQRHSVQLLFRAAGAAFVVSTVMGGGLDSLQSSESAAELVTGLMALGHSRSLEREADVEAVRRLNDLGYSAHGFAAFFRRHQADARKSGGLSAWLSTHPPTEERIEFAAGAAVGRAKLRAAPIGRVHWDVVKNRCARRAAGLSR